MKQTEIKETIAHSVNEEDDHWIVNCPKCDAEIRFIGFFDSMDIINCSKCNCQFRAIRLEFEDGSYIE